MYRFSHMQPVVIYTLRALHRLSQIKTTGEKLIVDRAECRMLVTAINRVLYDLCLFDGNVDEFYSPESNCINRVLEFKLGSPAALSLVSGRVASRQLAQGPCCWPGSAFTTGIYCEA